MKKNNNTNQETKKEESVSHYIYRVLYGRREFAVDFLIFMLAYIGLLAIRAFIGTVNISVLQQCALSLSYFYLPFRYIRVSGYISLLNILGLILFPVLIIELINIGVVSLLYYILYIIGLIIYRFVLVIVLKVK